MVYADYTFYKEQYRGAMPEPDFLRLSVRASAYIDQVTFGRIGADWEEDKNLSSRIRLACCAAADACLSNEQGGEVASQSVGSWSRTFVTSGKSEDQKLYESVVMYLCDTGLMYRGVEPCSRIR